MQKQISRMNRRVASVALAFAIVLVPAVIAIRSAQAQTFGVLYSFANGADGAFPHDSLILDSQGNLYGTTAGGGGGGGSGTVFKVDATGNETVLYRFTGTGGDGSSPFGDLVRDAQGNLYGTTYQGGGNNFGTVFKLDLTGKETVLYSFTGTGGDGAGLDGGLVLDAQGNLYGTTFLGGDLTCKLSAFGCGTVFKVDATGKETVLYTFTATGGDGALASGDLLRDGQGNLYGTTVNGGAHFNGTVFKLANTGAETVLYSFKGPGRGDGKSPYGRLVRDPKGNLYGTTYEGGASRLGTVFKLSKAGKETVLYSFTGTAGDGKHPYAGLVRDAQGNLYGTTYQGGGNNFGTVFKLDLTGKETVLHSFTRTGEDGSNPFAGLVKDAQGNLYGTTFQGGASSVGTVFKLTP